MRITIHTNPSQRHQREHAQWLKKGFKRHGLTLIEAHDINAEADIHIVSGPHYAKDKYINHPRVILLDRAYYHQEKLGRWQSMDWVSLGWMNKHGGRDFAVGSGRAECQCKDGSDNERSIFLADYNGTLEQADTVRLHPANKSYESTLPEILRNHGVAIGYKTSALVTAGLEGLKVICKDEANIVYNENWLELLPYADWHYSEMDEAIEHLWQTI